MPSHLQSTCQTAAVNFTPLSVVMMAGTPNLEIQPATRASLHAVAVVEASGSTSIHLVVLSMMVITWVKPSALAVRGPTRSTWIWVKRRLGTGIGCTGAEGWVVTLAFWQAWHSLHQRPTSAAMPFHTNLLDMSLLEARIPGWAKEWTARNVFFLQANGTNGRRRPEETSHSNCSRPTASKVKYHLFRDICSRTCMIEINKCNVKNKWLGTSPHSDEYPGGLGGLA